MSAGLVAASVVGLASPAVASATPRLYKCAAGFIDPGNTPAVGGFSLGLGQVVKIPVRNNNVLGLALTATDIYGGETHSAFIAPFSSHTFTFTKFGAEPVGWDFAFHTPADSVLAAFGIQSYYCGRQTGPVHSAVGGKCMDDYGSGTANGNKIDIWDCNGTSAQAWTWGYTTIISGWDDTIRVFGKCLDVRYSGTTSGTKVWLWTCNGTGAQKWYNNPDGSLVNTNSGLCLADPNGSTTNGTQLEVRTCNGKAQQRWTLPVRTILLN